MGEWDMCIIAEIGFKSTTAQPRERGSFKAQIPARFSFISSSVNIVSVRAFCRVFIVKIIVSFCISEQVGGE